MRKFWNIAIKKIGSLKVLKYLGLIGIFSYSQKKPLFALKNLYGFGQKSPNPDKIVFKSEN